MRFKRPGTKRKKLQNRAPGAYVVAQVRAGARLPDAASGPVPQTHNRIQDCHEQWHALVRAYHHPQHFRRELNTLIQSLRNVTFILQAEKSDIADFDSWYEPWREKMRASPVMRWIVDSRNRIVKKGDLDAKSIANASLVASYWSGKPPNGATSAARSDQAGEQAVQVSIDMQPAKSTKEQIGELAKLPDFFVREGYIELSRRWVDSALPDRELADACAEAFGFLALMMDDLYEKLGMESGLAFDYPGEGYLAVARLPHGRLPCMVPVDYSVRRFKLSNGTTDVGGTRYSFAPSKSITKKSIRRYGNVSPAPRDWQSVTSLADWCMGNARTILKRDRWHGWYVMLYRGNALVAMEALEARDRPDKMVMMRELASTVERSGIDGLVEVGDTWWGPVMHDEQGFIVAPTFQPDRREALSVVAEDAYGNHRQLMLPYRRVGRKIEFDGEPIDVSATSFANSLEPVREAWRRMGFSPLTRPSISDDRESSD